MDYQHIFNIVESFYEKAMKDTMIGFHFRHITDFDSHFPRISHFWNLQLGGTLLDKSQLPFQVIDVHLPLKIKKGQLGRWVVIFKETLYKYQEKNPELKEDIKLWEEKIDHFQNKFLSHPSLFLG